MKELFISIITISIIIYLISSIFLFIKQRDFLYFPTQQTKHPFNEEIFHNDDIKIKTTVLNKNNKNSIIYFGGNAENVDYNADIFTEIFPEHTIYLIKYRGYGGSTGNPKEKNLYLDALHIHDKIKSKYETVSVIGRSLGSGVATYLASKRDIDKLILVTPFDSIQNIAQEIFPLFPMSLLLQDKYNSIGRVRSIKSKTLIISAQNDQVIGKKHTEKLVNEFPTSQVIFKVVKGASHNSISDNQYYYELLQQFIYKAPFSSI